VSLSQMLWKENEDLAQAALGHRFVRGIGDGSLPLESFQSYVAQDAFFLESFARAYALAHSPDRDSMSNFADLIMGVLEELELHGSYAEKWGVRVDGVVPAGATLAYTDFLLSTAALKSVGEICAAMTPSMRLYAFLGRSLAEEEGQDQANPYADWIATYSDPEFDTLATTLERLLNRYASDAPGTRSAYRRAMELEIAFFEANYEAEIRSSGHE
jgi:thiaminase (transcriptional activator TenA)